MKKKLLNRVKKLIRNYRL